MRRHEHDPAALATAFRKLARLGDGGNSLMSSHPEPAARARRVEEKLAIR